MWLQSTVLNLTLILLDTSRNSYLLRYVSAPSVPKIPAHLPIFQAYVCMSISWGVVSMLRAMRVLMSSQILGRYMKVPACKRVIAPQSRYFLSSGRQIPHNFLYSWSSLTCGWLLLNLTNLLVSCPSINIYFSLSYQNIKEGEYSDRLSYFLNYYNSLVLKYKHIHLLILKEQSQSIFIMLGFYAFFALATTVAAINQRCDNQITQDTALILAQSCPAHSYCSDNGYCACDQGFIGSCAQNAYSMQSAVQINTNLTDTAYNFFEVVGDSEQYTLLSFALCHKQRSDILELIDVWADNGTIDIFSKENAEPGGKSYSVNQGCINLNTPFMKFGLKPNGQTEGFILGMRLASPGSIQISMTVTIQLLDFWALMTKLLFIIGGCFFLTLSVALGYIIYKWRRRRNFYSRTSSSEMNTLDHFQQYMPKIKFKDLTRDKVVNLEDELCSVCLLQMNEDCWVRKTICGHVFHQDCLDQWCKANLNCPICRKSFRIEQLKDQDPSLLSSNGSLRQNIL